MNSAILAFQFFLIKSQQILHRHLFLKTRHRKPTESEGKGKKKALVINCHARDLASCSSCDEFVNIIEAVSIDGYKWHLVMASSKCRKSVVSSKPSIHVYPLPPELQGGNINITSSQTFSDSSTTQEESASSSLLPISTMSPYPLPPEPQGGNVNITPSQTCSDSSTTQEESASSPSATKTPNISGNVSSGDIHPPVK